jgi:hypothetical protein
MIADVYVNDVPCVTIHIHILRSYIYDMYIYIHDIYIYTCMIFIYTYMICVYAYVWNKWINIMCITISILIPG